MGGERNEVPKQVPKTDQGRLFIRKWVCPTYMFNGTKYPKVISGSGYVITRAAACKYSGCAHARMRSVS